MVSNLEKNQIKAERPRNERKYLVRGLSLDQVEWLIKSHPAMFSEIFEERFVNSLYLDSFGMNDYHESVAGSTDRRKVRIRWYGDAFGPVAEPFLEFKSKKGLVGLKERFALAPFVFEKERRLDSISDLFLRSDLPPRTRFLLLTLEASLLTRYRRKYFQSTDKKFRITVDSGLESYHVRSGVCALQRPSFGLSPTVVELKYDPELDDEARLISNLFPFRMTKNSKYVSGLSRNCF